MTKKAPVLEHVYTVHDRAVNELADVHYYQLEQEILAKVKSRRMFTVHNKQVVCFTENVTVLDGGYSLVVTCYAASKKGKQRKVAVFYLCERELVPAKG